MQVEVVYAGRAVQRIARVEVGEGATIRDAIAAAGELPEFASLEVAGLCVGIFGKLATLDTRLRDGDRVEIYRPLVADPNEARLRRARKKAGKPAAR